MGNSTSPGLIVFAWGNASRADDGIGPLLAGRLRALQLAELVVVEDFQLNIEHVMDFNGMTPLLFIDASVAIDAGFSVERIGAWEDGNFSTHAISPQALLNVYRETTGGEPPEAFLLHVAAREFGLGEDLGEDAAAAVEDAWSFLDKLVKQPPSAWQAGLSAKAAPGHGAR